MLDVIEIKDKETWNNCADDCINFNVFHLFEWGEYKKGSWKVLRLGFYHKGRFQAATQILYKERFGYKFGWVSSGILVTHNKHIPNVVESLIAFLGSKYVIRFNFFDNQTGDVSFIYDGCSSLLPCRNTINSGYTVRFDLHEPRENIALMSSNNRYYYKKSLEHGLAFKHEDEVLSDKFAEVYEEMVERKGLDSLRIDVGTIKELSNALGEKLQMYSVYVDDILLSTCLVIFHKTHAYYYLASTSEEGRKKGASFFMVKELLDSLAQQKATIFDFGGITPFDEGGQGVNRFKSGFGGELIHYVGERQIASSTLLSCLFDRVVVRKLT